MTGRRLSAPSFRTVERASGRQRRHSCRRECVPVGAGHARPVVVRRLPYQNLKRDDAAREIPVWVAGVHADAEKAMALGADDFVLKPVDRKWLLGKLRKVAGSHAVESLLIIDDYLLKGMLAGTRFAVLEATGGVEGLRMARAERPRAILLDLIMADLSGFEVLDRLKAGAATRDTPVIVVTSKILNEGERSRLASRTIAIISKERSSRQGLIAAIREALTKAESPGKTFHA